MMASTFHLDARDIKVCEAQALLSCDERMLLANSCRRDGRWRKNGLARNLRWTTIEPANPGDLLLFPFPPLRRRPLRPKISGAPGGTLFPSPPPPFLSFFSPEIAVHRRCLADRKIRSSGNGFPFSLPLPTRPPDLLTPLTLRARLPFSSSL